MDIDFALVLVCLVAFCGVLWLLDSVLLKQSREQAVAQFRAACLKGKPDSGLNEAQAAELDELAREPLVIEYAKSFFPVLAIVLVLRSFLVEPFQIPTGSMIPTLEVGDFVLVNKYAYGLRLPVIGSKFMDVDDPQRGEVMVFIHPLEEAYYIKRVIGLPGDTIRYEDKNLYVNGDLIDKEYVADITVATSVGDLPGALYTEVINGIQHNTQFIDAAPNRRTRTAWVIPAGHYFMLGDNRDNSYDSRAWGTVPQENIVGKAIAVWMHKEPGLHWPSFSRNRLINQTVN